MKMLSVKVALQTTAFTITTLITFQNAALAVSVHEQQSASSLQKNNAGSAGNIKLAAHQKPSGGLRINPACDDTGEPCPHDETQDDMS